MSFYFPFIMKPRRYERRVMVKQLLTYLVLDKGLFWFGRVVDMREIIVLSERNTTEL